jgi:hypothetical protein
MLLGLLPAVVIVRAERLERTCEELLDVAAMALDVIADEEAPATIGLVASVWSQAAVVDDAAPEAHAAEWFGGEMCSACPLPASRLVEPPIAASLGRSLIHTSSITVAVCV